jgi:hypothetical protein
MRKIFFILAILLFTFPASARFYPSYLEMDIKTKVVQSVAIFSRALSAGEVSTVTNTMNE